MRKGLRSETEDGRRKTEDRGDLRLTNYGSQSKGNEYINFSASSCHRALVARKPKRYVIAIRQLPDRNDEVGFSEWTQP